MKYSALIFMVVLTMWSCKGNDESAYQDIAVLDMEMDQPHPGKSLMETYCYVCHAPKDSHDEQIAPPMIAVKKHYLNNDLSKEEFISAIAQWVKEPNEDKAKMFGAVRQFGLMPKTIYPDNTVELIADYIFDNKIDEPEWFAEHYQNRGRKGMGKGKVRFRNAVN